MRWCVFLWLWKMNYCIMMIVKQSKISCSTILTPRLHVSLRLTNMMRELTLATFPKWNTCPGGKGPIQNQFFSPFKSHSSLHLWNNRPRLTHVSTVLYHCPFKSSIFFSQFFPFSLSWSCPSVSHNHKYNIKNTILPSASLTGSRTHCQTLPRKCKHPVCEPWIVSSDFVELWLCDRYQE